MAPFVLRTTKQFVAASAKDKVEIFELRRPAITTNASNVKNRDWTKVATVVAADSQHLPIPSSLKLFGREIKGQALRNLAEDLASSRLRVNREGFCYVVDPGFGVQFLRLQDLFGWSLYGVDTPEDGITTTWNPCDMHADDPNGPPVVDYEELASRKRSQVYLLQFKEQPQARRELERAKEELAEFEDNSYWGAIDPDDSEKLVSDPWEADQVIQRRRKEFPPGIFRVGSLTTTATAIATRTSFWSSGPSLDEKAVEELTVVDQGLGKTAPTSGVDVETKDGKFDREKWWYIRTTHPYGGTTLLAYYEGSFASAQIHNPYTGQTETVPIPYSPNSAFRSDARFYLASLSSLRLRVVLPFITFPFSA
ncbi:unnamed protein product [Linum tenue]|uniref:Uncharacterized protein n=1 Tax=Linum tenue TaxID=586396 RepID=A0AAV0NAJ1_9ROSI|nr:unnamed protein product [Linum tenue]